MVDWLGAACTWLAATVLVSSGILKLGTTDEFQQALIDFRLPSWTWRHRAIPRVFPWVETALGLALLLAPSPWQIIPAVGALAVFVAFLILVVRTVRSRATFSCDCFGGIGDETVGRGTVVRNAGFVVLACLALGLHRAPATVVADRLATGWYPVPAVLAVAVAIAAVMWRTISRSRRRAHLVRTLSVTDADGAVLPITEFQDPPTFLVFFSPGCGSCHYIVPHFRWWPNLLREGYDLQPVFMGPKEAFARQEAFAPLVPYAWYADDSIARSLDITGTPSAILIDREHPLGGPVTSGQFAIQDLVLREGWSDEVRARSEQEAQSIGDA